MQADSAQLAMTAVNLQAELIVSLPRCFSGNLTADPLLFVVAVHLIIKWPKMLLQQAAFDLARWRHSLALDLRIKFAIENTEGLDLLDAASRAFPAATSR